MISDGADYNKVLQWHLKRFGRPMHKSKSTVALLKQFVEQERMRIEFENLDGLKELQFSSRYWDRFLIRQQMDFSTRKSDAPPFTENELNQFRREMDTKLMFYKRDDIFNCDESAWFFRETKGRIIVRKG